MTIETPNDALKAIQMVIQEERVSLGEPKERIAVTIEEKIRSEYERWMPVPRDEVETRLPYDREVAPAICFVTVPDPRSSSESRVSARPNKREQDAR